MNHKWKLIGLFCWLVCLACPIIIYVLVMEFGATELRSDEEPIPIAARAIDFLFFFDTFATGLLIWSMRGWRAATGVVAISLLCITAIEAFWGGLWVSGDWL